MADRKKYFAEYYQTNKEKRNEMAKQRLNKLKRKLGIKKFKEWKSIENKKYREKVKAKKQLLIKSS